MECQFGFNKIVLFIMYCSFHVTGGSWQQKLYHAVESSHMTLALLSQSYFNSKMCNEEFRLSLARHFTDVSISQLLVYACI